MKLSIISPYYNCLEYIKKLAKILEPQLNEETEWIIVDDGCNEKELDNFKAKVIHLPTNSGGASTPRNVGLDNAKGKFIVFIDGDDYVKPNYLDTIFKKINSEDFDYCYFSWESPHLQIIIEDEPPVWNVCVWNCIYKKELIGKERFDPNIIIGEDYNFNIRVRKGKKSNIKEILYYYNDNPNSLMRRGG